MLHQSTLRRFIRHIIHADQWKMKRKSVTEIASENARKFSKSYVAAFKVDPQGRPYHAGTITGIDLGHQMILVSARHVFEKDQGNESDEDDVIYVFHHGKLVLLDRSIAGALPLPDGSLLDLYVFVPESFDPAGIVPEPIPLSAVSFDGLKETQYLAACGFPQSRNKIRGKELTNRPYGYFGKVASAQATAANGYDPVFHFGIEINLKKTYRGGLKMGIAANPQGISGGPVFLVHDFEADKVIDCKLSGIVIARSWNSKSLICIHSSIIVEMALALFPPPDDIN